jgi:hypothetical protein
MQYVRSCLLYNYGQQGNCGLVRSYETEIFMAKFVADTPDVIFKFCVSTNSILHAVLRRAAVFIAQL